jgi:hypothetical protein
MHKELRYQVKTHAISDMPREKKNPANSPQIFLFFILLKICNMEKHHMQGKIKPDDANTKKNSRSTCFFCLSQQISAKFSQEK